MNTSLFDLQGRTALVTGAGRGLGKAFARALAETGADVAIADIDSRSAESAAREIHEQTGRSTLGIGADVTNEEQVDAMTDRVVADWSHIDILINNAGINIRKPIMDLSPEELDRVYQVNLKGVFLCSRRVAREMMKTGYGKIINNASVTSITIVQKMEMMPYYVTKAGVVQFTRAAAAEWAPSGICVNAISPGWLITDINRHLWDNPEFRRLRLEHTPMNRVCEIDDLIGTIIYLASSASDFVTGQNIPVDGGFSVW